MLSPRVAVPRDMASVMGGVKGYWAWCRFRLSTDFAMLLVLVDPPNGVA